MAAHKEVVAFIQEYFRDEPDGTIDTCAREAHSCGVPVRRDLIVSVRRDMTEEIKKLRLEQQQAKEARRPPVLSLVKPLVMPKLNIPVPQEEKTTGVSIEERRYYYDTVLLSTPGITITKAMQEVTKKHGRSVDVGYALASLKMVREMFAKAQSQPQPKEMVSPPRVPEQPPAPPKTAKEEAVTEYAIIYKTEKGELHELVPPTKLNSKILELISKGVSQSSIKVFRPVKLKMQVSIDLD